MKSFRKISILLVIVFGIVLFWLAPSLNKARDIQYTRIYEDTDKKNTILLTRDSSDRKHQKTTHAFSSKKTYKKESIRTDSKLKDIKPYMFSRSMQFDRDDKIFVTAPPVDSLLYSTIAIDTVVAQ